MIAHGPNSLGGSAGDLIVSEEAVLELNVEAVNPGAG